MDSAKAVTLLAATPTNPGVYIMKDAEGAVLYVGKAANLRSRLRSYFGAPGELSMKTLDLVPRIEDYEYIVTDSVAEALLLENTLIKQHKPRFNIRLKDDKTYPYIKITLNEDFPRLDVTRRPANDGSKYYGPFASASSMRKTMALLKRLFPYRSCTKVITGTDPRPCLEYHIHRCVAPCIGLVNKEQYRGVIEQVMLFLEGNHEVVVTQIEQEMAQAAETLQFERAATLRDQIRAIEHVTEEQKVVSLDARDQDIVATALDDDEAWVEVFFIRRGKLTGREHFIMEGTKGETEAAVLGDFVLQFYPSSTYIPAEVLLAQEPADMEELRVMLSAKRGLQVALRVPQRGERRKLVSLVEKNATEGLAQRRVRWLVDHQRVGAALEELQEALELAEAPQRIETYDISNIQGSSAVGSMVVFEQGQSKPRLYRRFKIKTVVGSDDYAMMQEMLRRRFGRMRKDGGEGKKEGSAEDESFGVEPSLVIIDGGKGHLNAALEVMLQLGLGHIPLASIAKREEEVFVPDMTEPIILARGSQGLYLVQRMRDEAHRFAITFHRDVRSKAARMSLLDEVPGVGPKRRGALLKRFGSVQGIREATVVEVAAVVGMTRTLAERVKEKI